jgi:hypothetical protein
MTLLTALLPALTAACGSTVEASTVSTASATSTSGGETTSTATGGVGGASPTTSGNGVTTSAATGGSGEHCGGFVGAMCGQDEFCDYPDNKCGAADGLGNCIPRPGVCDKNLDPVCACDGKVYSNACSAAAAGVDVSTMGSCMAPQGQFACGPKFCASGKQYCQRSVSDVSGVPDSYGCVPLPNACGSAPSCACLAGVACGSYCKADARGALTVTCPGG